jgi:hypothetical protein
VAQLVVEGSEPPSDPFRGISQLGGAMFGFFALYGNFLLRKKYRIWPVVARATERAGGGLEVLKALRFRG